jgi:Domain of unknown function (DUF1844)
MDEKDGHEEVKVEDRRRFDREGNSVDSTDEPVKENTTARPQESVSSEKDNAANSEPGMNFTSFLYSMIHTTLIQLGDVEDPIRKGMSENLEGAKHMIETLEMLQEKTKGNLDQLEQQYLEGALFDLRMRYLQKAKLIKW